MSDWISVDERLPEKSAWVFVWHAPSGTWDTAKRYRNGWRCSDEGLLFSFYPGSEITHWRPLFTSPEAP